MKNYENLTQFDKKTFLHDFIDFFPPSFLRIVPIEIQNRQKKKNLTQIFISRRKNVTYKNNLPSLSLISRSIFLINVLKYTCLLLSDNTQLKSSTFQAMNFISFSFIFFFFGKCLIWCNWDECDVTQYALKWMHNGVDEKI